MSKIVEPYTVLAADPPWLLRDSLPGKTRGASRQYPCMPLEEIASLDLPPLSAHCWLFLWYLVSMVDEARAVARAWGFQPTGGELIWLKTSRPGEFVIDPLSDRTEHTHGSCKLAFGMGRTVRNCDERCLIARRGRPRLHSKSERSLFFAPQPRLPNGKIWHSAKPERFFGIVERMTGPRARRVEMFARRRRPGWTTLGNDPALQGGE